MIDLFLAGAVAAGLVIQQPQHQHPPTPPAKPAPVQTPAAPPQEHVHSEPAAGAWHFMQDGAAFLTFNRQGGPRGDTEVISQNWWMGMASRSAGRGRLSFSLMLSLDPLTQYGDGYAALFQTGETWEGRPIIDRQHPHDFLMQAALTWRAPIGGGYNLTLSGAPVGEPTLGPVAFMHRQSAAENSAAPLAHHTLDSTHIAHGVIAAGIDKNEWAVESSLFRGREPDAQRWDLMDPGPLDSWAIRAWYRPSAALEFQASYGFLNEPEELEHVDVRRTTVSGSWLSAREGDRWTAVTAAFGRNDKPGGGNVAWLAEATRRSGRLALFTRAEVVQVETDLLLTGAHAHAHDDEPAPRDWVSALTLGVTHDVKAWRGFEIAAGADVTAYRVPSTLQPSYGDSPVSFHLFLRVRPPAAMGRMWNHVMTRPH